MERDDLAHIKFGIHSSNRLSIGAEAQLYIKSYLDW